MSATAQILGIVGLNGPSARATDVAIPRMAMKTESRICSKYIAARRILCASPYPGAGKKLSGCAPYSGRSELVVLGWPGAPGAKNRGELPTQRSSGVYSNYTLAGNRRKARYARPADP